MCAIGYYSALHGITSDSPEAMDEVESDGDKAALVLSLACRNYHILSIINLMWTARFY